MNTFFVPHDLKAPLKGASSGPLAGLTAAVKDLYAIAGEKTGGGNPDWLAHTQTATKHADAVEKVLAAGATIIGKTITDEFFYSVAGINAHYGTPANLRAPGRIPGGSSSGSAAATAAGVCDFALGSDTGGSVRIPASLCGLYGIRTTHGRVDASGTMDMAPSFDTVGWFANGPGVFRAVGSVLLGKGRVESKIENLLIADDGFAEADAEVGALLRDVISEMSASLPKPQNVRIAPGGTNGTLDAWREAVRVIQAHEIWKVYGRFIAEKKPKFGPGVAERMKIASSITMEQKAAADAVHTESRAHIRALIKPGTIMALPSAPCIAPRIDTPADALESYRVRVMRLTCTAGLGGLPQISIPAGTVSGCPVGLSFIAWAGGDEALLDLAAQISRHCGQVR
jgi:amidase